MDAFRHLVMEGYDHIVDVHDEESIINITYARGFTELGKFLEGIPPFEVQFVLDSISIIFFSQKQQKTN